MFDLILRLERGWISLYRSRTASSSQIKFQPRVPPPRGLRFQRMFLRAGSTCPPPVSGEHMHTTGAQSHTHRISLITSSGARKAPVHAGNTSATQTCNSICFKGLRGSKQPMQKGDGWFLNAVFFWQGSAINPTALKIAKGGEKSPQRHLGGLALSGELNTLHQAFLNQRALPCERYKWMDI